MRSRAHEGGPRVKTILGAFLVLCLLPLAAFGDEPEIGMIKIVSGKAFVTGTDGRTDAAVGKIVHQNDSLETGADGAVGVTFIDNTTLSLGPNSQITLTKYVFEPRDNNYAFVADMTKGSLMWVSGLITKLSPDAVALHTPVGTLGVRGTRFLVDISK